MGKTTIIRNIGAFVAMAVIAIAVLFVDTGINLIFLIQNHSWEIGAYALVNSLSCLILVAFSEWLEKKLKTGNPYITAAGLLAVFVIYVLRFTSDLKIDGPVYAGFPSIVLTAALIRFWLARRKERKVS